VAVPNDLDEIIKAIQLYARSPDIRGWAPTRGQVGRYSADRRAAVDKLSAESVDAMIDFSTPAGADAVISPVSRQDSALVWPRPASGPPQQATSATPRRSIAAALGAKHEPGGQPGHEAVGDRRPKR
jgi:hypothetical protein